MVDLGILQQLSKATKKHPTIKPEILQNYNSAGHDTKKCSTLSYISGKPIEFYLKNVFQEAEMMKEYNFYTETNLHKLKLFVETFLSQTNKPSSSLPQEILSPRYEKNQNLSTNDQSEGNMNQTFKIVRDQLNELRQCLKHFVTSLTEITQAEVKQLAEIDDLGIGIKAQRFKSNKQALFQESGDLVLFTSDLIKNLEVLDFDINRLLRTQQTAGTLIFETYEDKNNLNGSNRGSRTEFNHSRLSNDEILNQGQHSKKQASKSVNTNLC